MRTNNITLSEDTEVNDLETTKFNIETKLDSDQDDDENGEELNIINLNYKNKTRDNKLKLRILTGLICLLLLLILALFIGGFIYLSNSNNSINNNEHHIMDEIHIRGQVLREIRGNRTNEEECEARRCCDIRDGLTINDLPQGLDCKLLSDDECGDMDKYCEWDCDLPIIKLRKKGKFMRHFRRISGSPISYQQFNYNKSDAIYDNNYYNESDEIYDSYEKCLKEASKVISTTDDCGVEYNEELDPELIRVLCESHGDNNNIIYDGSGNGLYNLSVNNSIDLGEDSNDDRRRLWVFNPDSRSQVIGSSFPDSAVMLIEFNRADGSYGRCTGAMISNTWLLTAAHCIWSNGEYHTNIVVYKNIRDIAGYAKYIRGNSYTINEAVIIYPYEYGYIFCPTEPCVDKDHAGIFDIGILRLTRNPGTSYFGFGLWSIQMATMLFNDYQHPQDKGYALMENRNCQWNLYNGCFSTSLCSNWLGSSGGPIWRISGGGSNIIYGVFSHSALLQDGTYANIAMRIRSSTSTYICAYVEPDHPGRCY